MVTPSKDGVNWRYERNRFVAFAFAAADAFLEVDAEQSIKYADGAIQWLTGCAPERLTGVSLFDLVIGADHGLVRAATMIPTTEGRFGPIDVRFLQRNGTPRRVTMVGLALPGYEGRVFLALSAPRIGVGEKIGDQRADDRETGLLDKDAFSRIATEALAAGKDHDHAYNMTLLSFEGLEDLKKRLDAERTDELVSSITTYLKASSVNGSSAGRLDDEQYGLVHEPGLDVAALEQMIVQHAADLDPADEGLNVATTTMELEADDASEADCAQALIYTINKFSESHGDFTITDLSESYKLMLDETRKRMNACKQIITTGAYDQVFQPIVDLATREVHHYEALVRVQDTTLEPSTFKFISFLEGVGLIAEFDLTMCRKVIDKIRSAHQSGGDISVAVNLSARSLTSPAFVDKLHKLLEGCGSMRNQLLFEVTESWKIKDLDAINDILRGLRARGHQICLDDFGAGSAAFQYLRALDVDYVKIDGVYVRESLTKPNGKAFLRSMANLCHELDIDTVGEMVENEDVAAFLQEAGVRYGQGYLFGEPTMGVGPIQQRRVS
ncbi:MAG: EAL domain-containing protein [Alphaproteobacteria bacterium]